MRPYRAQSEKPDSAASYLADREGLTGKRREVFLELLHNAFGFKLRRPRWATAALCGTMAILVSTGIGLEMAGGREMVSFLAWIGNSLLALLIALGLVCAGRRPQRSSREIEWGVYRLLIRPAIIIEKPGLLDRNAAVGSEPGPSTGLGISTGFTVLWNDVWPNVWVPAAIGWIVGGVVLTGLRLSDVTLFWVLALPSGGTILSPLAWGGFRLLVLRWMERGIGQGR